MRRLGWAILILSACRAAPPPSSLESDFLRISFFRFDPVSNPTQTEYVYQPSAWVLYSKSWMRLRAETKTESYFAAFPKWSSARVTERGIVLDANAIALSTGILHDSDMRDYLRQITAAGLQILPNVPEPDAEFFRKMRQSKEGRMVRMIRIENESTSYTVLLHTLQGDLNDPKVKDRIETFLRLEKYILSLMTHNTRLIRVGVGPQHER